MTLVWHRPRWTAGAGLLVLVWTYFALYSVRNIPLLVLVTAPLLAPVWSSWLRARWPVLAARVAGAATVGRGWPLVGAVVVMAFVCVPRPVRLQPEFWPVAAVEYVKSHPAEFGGNLFNQYAWGGYLLAELPEHKVFVDGRTDFYGEPLVREFWAVTELATNWLAVLEKYDVQWSLMPTDHRLNEALALAGWECAHTDPVATIYRRQR